MTAKILDAPTIVSVLVVLMFAAAILLMMVRPSAMSSDQFNILNVLLGALSAAFATVVSYWLGSSSGSKEKDTTISTMSSKNSQP